MKFEVVVYRKLWFLISALLVIGSIAAIGIWGLKFGIDFTGGSLLEVDFTTRPAISEARDYLADSGYDGASVQGAGEHGLLIRTKDLSEADHQALLTTLRDQYGELEELRFDSIGPVIGEELRRNSLMGVGVLLILIGLYVAWAFRKVSGDVKSWKYGVLTILTAFHDVIISVGIFAVLGNFYGWEVGTAFVAAALTILGYSINDTVVVFDRTRENLKNHTSTYLDDTVEKSIQQTFRRSLYTSVTTLLALGAIFFFGGDTTQPFALALMIGIAVGTFSSLFLASPLLVEWELRSRRA